MVPVRYRPVAVQFCRSCLLHDERRESAQLSREVRHEDIFEKASEACGRSTGGVQLALLRAFLLRAGAFGLSAREPSVSDFVSELLTNQICDVYWFIYSIIGLYLVTPLLSYAARNKQLLRYLLALSFVSTAVIPLINRFAPTHTLLSLFAIPYLTGPIFFYLLGYYVQHHVEIDRRARGVSALVIVGSLAIMVGMTLKTNIGHTVASGEFADFDNFYLNIQHVFCACYSCAVFGLLKGAEPWFQKCGVFRSAGFRLLSSVTLYVYLIHMLVINMLDVYVPHSVIWDLGVRPPVVVLVSVMFGLLLVAVKNVANRALCPF